MTSKRANAVNRAIAAALGLEVRQNKDKFEQTKYHIFPAVEDFLPDCYTDMNTAIAAAGELLNYGLCIFLDPNDPHITYKNGKRDEFGDLWTRLSTRSNAPADIAAAICEAIVQARGW